MALDFAKKSVAGDVALTFTALSSTARDVDLDAKDLTIHGAKVGGSR